MRSISKLKIPVDVKNDVEMIVSTLLSKFAPNIDKIILFGSYATGRYQPDSDIDLMITLNELPSIKQRRLYTQAIDIDRDVDLLFCTNEQLLSDAFVYKRVNEQGVVLYEQFQGAGDV